MISEGSCDTEVMMPKDLHQKNKLHFQIYSNSKQLFITVLIFHNITVLLLYYYLGQHKIKTYVNSKRFF